MGKTATKRKAKRQATRPQSQRVQVQAVPVAAAQRPPDFDYNQLTPQAAKALRQHTAELRALATKTAQNIVEIGTRLAAVKESLGHGQFTRWLQTEFDWGERTAQNMMRVAEMVAQAGDADATLPGVSTRALFLLAAPSTPDVVRDAARAAAAAGNPPTYADVRSQVDAAADKPPATQQQLDAAARARAGKADANGDGPESPQDETTGPVQDALGNVLPDKLLSLWQRRDEITALMKQVQEVKLAAENAAAGKDALWHGITVNQLVADCNNVYRALKAGRPHALCPYCGGRSKSCKPCAGTGLVGKDMYERYTPEDLKQ